MSHRTPGAYNKLRFARKNSGFSCMFGGMVVPQSPRVVWALGGGGARGLAHLGVLRVLEEEKIPISGLVGTSMGAVVAAAYAAGGKLDYLSRVATALSWEQLWDFRFPRLGLINGEKIMAVLRLLTKKKKLEELNPPVWVVATDLLTGTEVVFKEGSLEPAIRATISIPGVFIPVKHGNYLLVDGGVVAGVPAGIARQMGADLVIAVNVSYDLTPLPPGNIFEVLMKTAEIMGARLKEVQVAQADLVITPRVGHVGTGHFSRAADCIAAGEEAARRMLPAIRRLLGRTHPGPDGCGCDQDEAFTRACDNAGPAGSVKNTPQETAGDTFVNVG